MSLQSTPLLPALLLSSLLVGSGCTPEPEITRRKVPELPEAAASSSAEKIDGRMLAAIVPAGGRGWFLKISGPEEPVGEQQQKFVGLLESLEIKAGKPVWETPEGWSEQPASGMRAATFKIRSGDSELECSVIPLPADDPTADDYLLSNINRWRGQLELQPQSLEELKESDSFHQFELDDGTPVTWVDLSGKLADGGGMRAPFAGGNAPFAGGPAQPIDAGKQPSGKKTGPAAGPGLPPGHPPTASAGDTGSSVGESGPPSIPEMSFDVPEGWTPGRLKPFRKISWNITHDGKSAEFYISSLAAAGSAIGPNVNRWRTQAGLDQLSEEELASQLEDISIGGDEGKLVEIFGPKQSIIGTIVVKGDTGWFFKMVGDRAVVAREKERLRAFLESVSWKS